MMIFQKIKNQKIREASSTKMSDIQSPDVIFFPYATGFKRLNIVGSVHDIPFFETRIGRCKIHEYSSSPTLMKPTFERVRAHGRLKPWNCQSCAYRVHWNELDSQFIVMTNIAIMSVSLLIMIFSINWRTWKHPVHEDRSRRGVSISSLMKMWHVICFLTDVVQVCAMTRWSITWYVSWFIVCTRRMHSSIENDDALQLLFHCKKSVNDRS